MGIVTCKNEMFNGVMFYTAELYQTFYNTEDSWYNLLNWLVDTYGTADDIYYADRTGRWGTHAGKFWFRDECDRTFFILRWT